MKKALRFLGKFFHPAIYPIEPSDGVKVFRSGYWRGAISGQITNFQMAQKKLSGETLKRLGLKKLSYKAMQTFVSLSVRLHLSDPTSQTKLIIMPTQTVLCMKEGLFWIG